MTTAPLCFLDTETDGVHPDRKAWEIACIRRDPDGSETEWHGFVDIDLSTADPFGLRVGRFYDRHPLGRYLAGSRTTQAPDGTITYGAPGYNSADVTGQKEAAHQVARLTHGAHIVGAVPNFDTEVLAQLLRAQGLTPAWNYHLIDIENIAVGYLAATGNPIAPPWNSDALTTALAVDPGNPEERHTALGDTRWAKRVYDAVMASA